VSLKLLLYNRFQEIKKKDKIAAMQFLQTSVSELIDHSDEEQTREVSSKKKYVW
jgi:hypothetical protein